MALTVSVVVPAFNAAPILKNCLDALQSQTHPPDEIIVVDDGSTDDTFQVAQRLGARVYRQANQGPAAARNCGTQNARGDLILFTDADCEPIPEWIANMIAPFANSQISGTKGAYHTRQREWIARLIQLEYEIRYERMARLPRIDFIDSHAAAYRREVLLKYGGFDPFFPSNRSVEDIDLSFRLARAGVWMVFVPSARVWHRHPTSLWLYLKRKFSYGWWRALLYLRFPEKMMGDAHTAPVLKAQFALLALALIFFAGGIIWLPLAAIGGAAFAIFLATTLSFTHWAWSRDKPVALAWIPVTVLRVAMQGAGLGLGLVWYRVFAHTARAMGAREK